MGRGRGSKCGFRWSTCQIIPVLRLFWQHTPFSVKFLPVPRVSAWRKTRPRRPFASWSSEYWQGVRWWNTRSTWSISSPSVYSKTWNNAQNSWKTHPDDFFFRLSPILLFLLLRRFDFFALSTSELCSDWLSLDSVWLEVAISVWVSMIFVSQVRVFFGSKYNKNGMKMSYVGLRGLPSLLQPVMLPPPATYYLCAFVCASLIEGLADKSAVRFPLLFRRFRLALFLFTAPPTHQHHHHPINSSE